MNKKHINKFPIGTLVAVEEKHLGVKVGEIYGIVTGHTSLNVEILLSKPIAGNTHIVTSPRLIKSVQRPYQKPNVQRT